MSSFTDKVLARGMKVGQTPWSFTDEIIAQGVKTRNVYADAAPESAKSLRKAIQWLKQAKRFGLALPLIPHGDEERRIARMDQYAHAVAAPPPAKFTVFEYEHGGSYRTEPDLTRALSTKRAALCVDLESVHAVTVKGLSNFVRDPEDSGGLMIWPINYFDEKRDWEFSAAAVILRRHACLRYVEAEKHKATLMERLKGLLGRPEEDGESEPIEASFLELLPEIAQKLADEDRFRIYTETAMDAVWTVLGALEAMQCANVVADEGQVIWLKGEGTLADRKIALDPYHGRRVQVQGIARWVQESTLSFT